MDGLVYFQNNYMFLRVFLGIFRTFLFSVDTLISCGNTSNALDCKMYSLLSFLKIYSVAQIEL